MKFLGTTKQTPAKYITRAVEKNQPSSIFISALHKGNVRKYIKKFNSKELNLVPCYQNHNPIGHLYYNLKIPISKKNVN